MNQTESGRLYQIGLHKINIFEDYYRIIINGNVNEEEAKKINEIQDKYFKGKQFFTICGLAEMGSVSPGARKQFANANSENAAIGIAFWGASFQTRIVANLILTAINLVRKQATPSVFFKTEPEALAWIEQKRRELIK